MSLYKMMKSGITLGQIVLAGLAAYGGYDLYRDWKNPYSIEKEGYHYFLEDKRAGLRQPITRDFQLGDINYRVEGILKESKRNLEEVLDEVANKYDLR